MEISSDLLLWILAGGAFALVGVITSEIILILRAKKDSAIDYFHKSSMNYN